MREDGIRGEMKLEYSMVEHNKKNKTKYFTVWIHFYEVSVQLKYDCLPDSTIYWILVQRQDVSGHFGC